MVKIRASLTNYNPMLRARAKRLPVVSRGFTLVELLIVVVVIAILAAITIVSYNGITSRASATVLQSDLSNANKFMMIYKLENGAFPSDLTVATAAGLKVGSNTVLSYSLYDTATPAYYTLTASDGKQSFYINSASQSSPVAGAWITNSAANPGFETSASSNWSTYWGPTRVRETADKHSGNASLSLTQVSTGTSRGDGIHLFPGTLPDVQEGATYQASFWFKAPAGTHIVAALKINTGWGGRSSKFITGNGNWQRVELDTYQAVSSDINSYKLALQIIMTSSTSGYVTPAVGTKVYIDDVLVQITPPGQYSQPSQYADGDSPGWSWTGTQGISTSQGPTL